MRRVKIILLLLLMTLLTLACGAGAKESSGKQSERFTTDLTYELFRERVADIEENPQEWLFLGERPAIIDFWADWCIPCKRLSPILEQLAEEYQGKIDIYKIDTDKESKLASLFGISAIPTLLFIPMGEDPQVAQGALPKEEIKKIIDQLLLKNKE